jgi:hypothetical protein
LGETAIERRPAVGSRERKGRKEEEEKRDIGHTSSTSRWAVEKKSTGSEKEQVLLVCDNLTLSPWNAVICRG